MVAIESRVPAATENPLAAARRKRKLSQQGFARKFGINIKTVERVEGGLLEKLPESVLDFLAVHEGITSIQARDAYQAWRLSLRE